MRVNRKVLEAAFRTGEPLYKVVDRCVGKTTRAIFRAIADSYDHLGIPIPVCDPDAKLIRDKDWLFRTTVDVIRTNKLDSLIVSYGRNGQVMITNQFAEYLVQPVYHSTAIGRE